MDTGLFDEGAQAERTALAWQRTAISTMTVAALLIHARFNGQFWSGLVLAGTAASAVLVLVPCRYRCVLRAVRADTSVPPDGAGHRSPIGVCDYLHRC
jgi:uncharacterized membrane protein YidH (DUF202 family)